MNHSSIVPDECDCARDLAPIDKRLHRVINGRNRRRDVRCRFVLGRDRLLSGHRCIGNEQQGDAQNALDSEYLGLHY